MGSRPVGEGSGSEDAEGASEVARLRRAGIRPTRALGQHFLFNPRLLEYIVEQAAVGPGDHVLEVGPGSGALTRRLLARGAAVTAVELDDGLSRLLEEELGGQDGFRLVRGDVLDGKHELHGDVRRVVTGAGGPIKLVSNLPFCSATPFLVTLLEQSRDLSVAVVTVQLEVADRFVAAPGRKSYGIVSVVAQVLARVEKLKRIRRLSFWPPPRVDAAVVRFTPHREGKPPVDQYRALKEVLRFAFAERRKQLRSRLEARWPGVVTADALVTGARPEDVEPAGFLEIAARIVAANQGDGDGADGARRRGE